MATVLIGRSARARCGRALLAALTLLALPQTAHALRPARSAAAYLDADHAVMPRALVEALRSTGAIPSFSRQTRLPCSACHYQFPQLTPFGRLFKLNGYVLTGLTAIPAGADTTRRTTLALAPIPPASAMFVASLTRTRTAVPGTQNGSTSFPQQASLFLAGAVTPRVGAFTQFTYSAADGSVAIDNIDLRFANHARLGAQDLLYGLTLHNNPTVQDVWNTVPAWGFPFMSSEAAPSPAAATLLDGALGQQVLGLGAYGLWRRLLYAEFTAYRTARQGAPNPPDSSATDVVRNIIPYWRVALQHQFGRSYVMVGTYGFDASLFRAGVSGPTDRLTDLAADVQLEHLTGAEGVVILRSTFLHERQRRPGTLTAQHTTDRLNTLRVNASYQPSGVVGLTAGYFGTTGRADTLLYPPGPVTGSATGRPDTRGFLGELAINPWQNVRLAAQYVGYTRFNGAGRNYDAAGRRASDNDTLYLFTWLVF